MGFELTGNYVSSTYLRLVQYVSDNFYDGSGNLLNITTSSSLNDILINYIPNASLSSDFYWQDGQLEISTGFGGPTFAYIDGSLSARDSSITDLYDTKLNSTNGLFRGLLTINGSIALYGNLIQDGCIYETHAEQVYTKDDFIIMRDGALLSLPDSSISGIKIKIPDGSNDVVFGTGNDAILRVGWENDTLVKVAAREDAPIDGGYAYWDDSSSIFKTYDLINHIDSSFSLISNVEASLGLYYTSSQIDSSFSLKNEIETSLGLYYTSSQIDSSFSLKTNVEASLNLINQRLNEIETYALAGIVLG